VSLAPSGGLNVMVSPVLSLQHGKGEGEAESAFGKVLLCRGNRGGGRGVLTGISGIYHRVSGWIALPQWICRCSAHAAAIAVVVVIGLFPWTSALVYCLCTAFRKRAILFARGEPSWTGWIRC
jgi:hypothetical protein